VDTYVQCSSDCVVTLRVSTDFSLFSSLSTHRSSWKSFSRFSLGKEQIRSGKKIFDYLGRSFVQINLEVIYLNEQRKIPEMKMKNLTITIKMSFRCE